MQGIHPSVWMAPGVQVYGRVTVEAGSSFWPNAVVRAECHEVRIGRATNVQDFVMIHVDYEGPTVIGDFCSIAHHATVHGATVQNDCLVGVGATLMDGSVLGEGSIVAGGALVREGMRVPPGSIVAGVPAKVIAERDSAQANRLNAWLYHRNAGAYRLGEHRAWDGEEFETWKRAKWARVLAGTDRDDSLEN